MSRPCTFAYTRPLNFGFDCFAAGSLILVHRHARFDFFHFGTSPKENTYHLQSAIHVQLTRAFISSSRDQRPLS
jgi:hypothetical protein